MKQTQSNIPSLDVFFLSEDGSVDMRLYYFFSVSFQCRTQVIDKYDRLNEFFKSGEGTQLLVYVNSSLHRNQDAESAIREVATMASGPFILVLNTNPDAVSTVTFFAAGADEVLGWPIPLDELAYRLRSRSDSIGKTFLFTVDQLQSLDFGAEMVRRASLTDVEAQVLRVLVEHRGQTVSRDALSLAVDKSHWTYGNRKFDVHIARIRKKLARAYGSKLSLETIRSAGYQLGFPEDE